MNDQPEHTIEAMESAQARAGMYSFLANLFNQRPDMELVSRMREVDAESFNLTGSSGEISDQVERGMQEMASYIKSTLAQPQEKVQETLAVDWTRLFRGVSPSYGPPPPYEGVYVEGAANQSEVLQSIMRIYHEHSVDVDEEATNRPDYIGVELDFLRYLNQTEADAWEKGEEERAVHYQAAQKDFLSNHLGRWAERFCDRAMEEAKTDFYRGFIRLTKGVMKEQMESFI